MSRLFHRLAWLALAVAAGAPLAARAQPPAYEPRIEASDEAAERALARFRLAPGLKAELFASEPRLANPVAFTFDEWGRCYVAETFRLHAGVTDIRGHMDWLDDDLACRTVADRLAMYRKHLQDRFDSFAAEHDRVRRIEDRDGDGRADFDSVFADGFRNHADGIGAGLLARRGKVWYTCIPDLWLLEDRDGDGAAEKRESLQTGYGVHVGFIGHDLHGLRMGPDGRLYFSIGDRGLHVETPQGVVDCPDSGAVLRCWPDGSGLELFAVGLRNPQELAFDDFGNLFTGDNNSDGGDRARIVHVVEGGDSGWRIGYQFITEPVIRGPWNGEFLWKPDSGQRAAYHLPPLRNLGDGPSGLDAYPGAGFGPEMAGRFLMCDFRGADSSSGVRSFRLRPRGASFEVVDDNQLVWSLLATDVEFAPDGAFYVSDWVAGWEQTGRGRIYRFFDPEHRGEAADVARLLQGDPSSVAAAELAARLAHADRRVRQEAQFELAARGAVAELAGVATRSDAPLLARIHAAWGLGQVARSQPDAVAPLVELLRADDAPLRAQAAKVLGDARFAAAFDSLRKLTTDADAQVRFQAAMALGKLGRAEAVDDLASLLADNADADPYLRHACVWALHRVATPEQVESLAESDDPHVRMGALLVMRQLRSPAIRRFLADSEPRLMSEAARAIGDLPIEAALPDLAELQWTASDDYLAYRVMNANFRLGGPRNARRLVEMAAGIDSAPLAARQRVAALELLAGWASPPGRDYVVGLWRPLVARAAEPAVEALAPHVDAFLEGEEGYAAAAIEAVKQLGVKRALPSLRAVLDDKDRSESQRAAALAAMARLGDEQLLDRVSLTLADAQGAVRAEALKALAHLDPDDAVGLLARAVESGSPQERQSAWTVLGSLRTAAAADPLSRGLARLERGEEIPELELEILEAVRASGDPELGKRLAAFEVKRASDELAKRRSELLAGGDPARGRKLFFEHATAQCLRCHQVGGQGGSVGPALDDVGSRLTRAQLLESLLEPNRTIAKGFETAVIETDSGEVLVGVVQADTPDELRLISAEGKELRAAKSEIVNRTVGVSAMPANLEQNLQARELRDLVEFLAGLAKPAK